MNDINIKNRDDLTKAIVEAIAFFDMFDFPLTDFEVWKFIWVKCSLFDAQSALKELSSEVSEFSFLRSKSGFYFLKGRDDIINIRQKRKEYTGRKFRRAKRIAKIFQFIPWIKMIAVSNIIGERNLKDESDIDLFIITKNKKIWLTRFFSAGIAKVLGLRPKKGNERDKICLNFYVSEEAMDLSGLMLKENRGEVEPLRFSFENRRGSASFGSGDVYFRYWLVNLVPVYEVGDAYKKFIQANNQIKNYFSNWRPAENEKVLKNKSLKFNFLNLFFGALEDKVKKLQLKMMPREMKEIMNKDTRVVVSDSVLKLHVNDRREEYRKRFYDKIFSFLSS